MKITKTGCGCYFYSLHYNCATRALIFSAPDYVRARRGPKIDISGYEIVKLCSKTESRINEGP